MSWFSTWFVIVLVEPVLHLVYSPLYLHCPFLPLILGLLLTLVLYAWVFLLSLNLRLGRFQFLELLFQLLNFVLDVLLSRIHIRISNRWFALSMLWAIFVIFYWSPPLFSLECVHDHVYELLIIAQGSKVIYRGKCLIHLAMLFQVKDTRVKGFVLGK